MAEYDDKCTTVDSTLPLYLTLLSPTLSPTPYALHVSLSALSTSLKLHVLHLCLFAPSLLTMVLSTDATNA